MRKNKNILVAVPKRRFKNYVTTVIKGELRDLKPCSVFSRNDDGSAIIRMFCNGWQINIVAEDEMRYLNKSYAYCWIWQPLVRKHHLPMVRGYINNLDELRAVVSERVV